MSWSYTNESGREIIRDGQATLTPTELLDRTTQPRQAVQDARDWLADCTWGEGEDAYELIRLENAVGIVAAVERHHEDGWIGFARANGYWDGRTPRERQYDRAVDPHTSQPHCGHCNARLEHENAGCDACGGRQEP